MTMPKKGRRKITVNNIVYHYFIKRFDYPCDEYEFMVTLQNTSTLAVYTRRIHNPGVDSITPKDVRNIIMEAGI